MSETKTSAVPFQTIRRLPNYLRVLRKLSDDGVKTVSSEQIATAHGQEAIQVRKDLSYTGVVGKPRVGYEIEPLIDAIAGFLGWDNTSKAFLVGVGHLGSALLGYKGFETHGLDIVAAFDSDPARVGLGVGGKVILEMDRLNDLAGRMHVHLAIMTVPYEAAQEVADQLVLAGIRGIWNFSSAMLSVPPSVVVQNEDLSAGLAALSAKVAGVSKR